MNTAAVEHAILAGLVIVEIALPILVVWAILRLRAQP
jgi:hypothetical protein